MTNRVLRSPDAPAATAGGQNGVGQITDPRASLAALLSQADEPAAPESDPSAVPPAEGDPETPVVPAAEGEPGQADLPPDETPQAGEEPGSGEPSEPNLSEESQAELTQALAGLSPKERQSALDLVKQLQPGEIPRIAKLVAEKHQLSSTVETLQKQVEELESSRDTVAAAPATAALPETVLKLKTPEAVEARKADVESWVEQITDLLDTNPDPGAVYDIAEGVQRTRQQLIERRASLRGELKALGQRGQQIQSQARLREVQAQFRAQTRADFPWLADAEHPRTQAVQQMLQQMPGLKQSANPEYWAAVVLEGQKALKAELASRKGAKPAVKGTVPTGKVPLGKPHAGGAGGAAAGEGGGLRKALDTHGKTGSRSSFAAVIAAQNGA